LSGGMNGRQLADFGRTVRPDLKVLSITVCREGRDDPNQDSSREWRSSQNPSPWTVSRSELIN
jgi:hypothetical protein